MSFGTLELAQRLRRDSVLMKIDVLIDCEELRSKLTGLYKRELSHGGGQEPFDRLMMFKAILLGQCLSDAALEQALYVRIDSLRFCGLSLSDAIPDETTLCRFRNRLVTGDRLDDLLASINEQLQSHGLKLKGATGAVIDATLIESAARQKLANKLISKKRYIVEQCFGTTKVNAQVMLKSICHLHESKKSCQQNFCGQATKGSSPSKCCIRGKTPFKKRKNLTFCQNDTRNKCHLDISPIITANLRTCAEVFSIAISRRRKMNNSGYNNKIYTRHVPL